MATPLVVSNAALLTLNWSGETRTWNNVIGVIGDPTLPVINQTLVNTFFSDLKANASFISFVALLAPTVILESVAMRSLDTANLPEFVAVGTPLAGGGTGDPLPLSVAGVATIRTAFAGKRFRGRTYFSGFTEAQNDANGRMSAAAGTAVVAAIGGISASLNLHGMSVAVVGRPRAGRTIPEKIINPLPGIVTKLVSVENRNLKWESQRRRTGRS